MKETANPEDEDECELEIEDVKDYSPSYRLKRSFNSDVDKRKRTIIKQTTPTAVRYGLSNTAHCALIASTVAAAGSEDDFSSISSTKRLRSREINRLATDIKNSFLEDFAGYPKLLQWDGKIMEVTSSKETNKEDVNAVVLSVPGSSLPPKAVGAPNLSQGTGIALAQSSLEAIREFTAIEDLIGGVFDTTSANTGLKEGAMCHLERLTDTKLLWLPCRHHISELHIKHAYTKVMMPSNSPEDPLFKAFKEWFVQQRDAVPGFPEPGTFRTYDWGVSDTGYSIGPCRKEEHWFMRQTLDWLQEHLLKDTFPRADYREMCELINFILGGDYVATSKRKTSFTLKKPGACHHARFMAKAIYLLKIYILSLIFNRLTPRQMSDLERMVLFIICLYGKYFLQSSLAVAAPRLDYEFQLQMRMYESIDPQLSDCVLKSVYRHLWYLTPELIVLSLFDPQITLIEKETMAKKLSNISVPDNFERGKPSFDFLNENLCNVTSLSELINENSWFLFEKSKEYLNAVGIPSSMG